MKSKKEIEERLSAIELGHIQGCKVKNCIECELALERAKILEWVLDKYKK